MYEDAVNAARAMSITERWVMLDILMNGVVFKRGLTRRRLIALDAIGDRVGCMVSGGETAELVEGPEADCYRKVFGLI